MKTAKILLDHGSGGKMSHRLIGEIMLPIFDNPILSPLNDRQRLSLVYLRHHNQITNNDYRRLNRVDTMVAGLVKPYDPESTSRKHAKYIPFWA
jgi:hypothetical protein